MAVNGGLTRAIPSSFCHTHFLRGPPRLVSMAQLRARPRRPPRLREPSSSNQAPKLLRLAPTGCTPPAFTASPSAALAQHPPQRLLLLRLQRLPPVLRHLEDLPQSLLCRADTL